MLSLLPVDVPDACNCCNGPGLLQWHRIARRLDPEISCAALKADGIVDEDGEDAFLDDELAIAAALSAAWQRLAPPVEGAITDALKAGYSPGNLLSAIDAADDEMGRLFDYAEPVVAEAVASTIATGSIAITGDISSLAGVSSAAEFERAIIRACRYSTNRFFNTQVVPAIIRALDGLYDRLDAPAIADVQAMIATHFRTVPYWELVANVAASRGYHYGMLRTMQQRNILGFRFVAVMDERTSRICRAMNGREFLVADAVNLLDALAEDTDPEAPKRRTPWVKEQDVEGRSSAELASMGVMIPALHPRCRSTIRPIT